MRLPSPPNKSLKKKTLCSLPKLNFIADLAPKFTDCAICLAKFAAGDEVRKLRVAMEQRELHTKEEKHFCFFIFYFFYII